MAGGIFVSFRRDDTRQAADRLADNLVEQFGAKPVFRDIETIELGVDFAEALNQALETCVVMLALIGGAWLDIKSAKGQRRLDDPHDWIRLEIAMALKRGIRVVPVLVDGAESCQTRAPCRTICARSCGARHSTLPTAAGRATFSDWLTNCAACPGWSSTRRGYLLRHRLRRLPSHQRPYRLRRR